LIFKEFIQLHSPGFITIHHCHKVFYGTYMQNTVLDEDSDFEDFRSGVVELTRDIVFVVGSLNTFHDLFSHMIRPGLPWNAQEACLHMMYAVAPSIRP